MFFYWPKLCYLLTKNVLFTAEKIIFTAQKYLIYCSFIKITTQNLNYLLLIFTANFKIKVTAN